MTTTTSTLVELVPAFSLASEQPLHQADTTALVPLHNHNDDYYSFVSYSRGDGTVKRWVVFTRDANSTNNNQQTIRLASTIEFPAAERLYLVMGKDRETMVTSTQMTLRDRITQQGYLKVWDTKTLESLNSVAVSRDTVTCMVWNRDKTTVYCGTTSGKIQRRTASKLQLESSYHHHFRGAVTCICELSDGSFVSGGEDRYIYQWGNGRVTEFEGHSWTITSLIELKEDVIVSASADNILKFWRVSTVKCCKTVTLPLFAAGPSYQSIRPQLVHLPMEMFATASHDGVIRVWNIRGECVQSIETSYPIDAVMRVGQMIVTASRQLIEIRLLK